MSIGSQEGVYTGEVNNEGEAHGYGTFVSVGIEETFKGTFSNGKPRGLFEVASKNGLFLIGELNENGAWCAKRTAYWDTHEVANQSFEPYYKCESKLLPMEPTKRHEAWFGTGRPLASDSDEIYTKAPPVRHLKKCNAVSLDANMSD